MKLKDAIVLITGANRGIGLAFAEAALARGTHDAGCRSCARQERRRCWSLTNGLRNELRARCLPTSAPGQSNAV